MPQGQKNVDIFFYQIFKLVLLFMFSSWVHLEFNLVSFMREQVNAFLYI